MLKKLHVENYALIDRLELEFSDSLNIITGETGAGKSILLGALGLLQGNRCDASVVKDGERNCIVEGDFDIGNYALEGFFSENDLDYSPNTIIRRVISPTGKSRAYVNDLPVQVTTLKELGTYLIDIHSQHQSLMIAEDGFRINVLDSVAAHKNINDSYSDTYHAMRSAERELGEMKKTAEQNRKDEEWLAFQVEELEDARLDADELEQIEASQKELSHADEIKKTLIEAAQILEEDDDGVLVMLRSIEQGIARIASYYPMAEEVRERIHSAIIELRDINQELSSEGERIEADPAKLEQLEARLNTIYTLQQKHKISTVEELIALHHEYERRLSTITDGDQAITELESKIVELTEKATALATKITTGRSAAAKKITKHVEQMLTELGMPGSKFVVEITAAESLRASGMDNIRFLFSGNKEIEPAPVEKIASGGEISRLMLALKLLVAQSSKLPTIIFDEIDSGVSGRIADAMGKNILDISENMQVVNITHLPQVASKGNTHFMVYKQSSRTMIRRLNSEERVDEIAKMLSGSTISDAATAQARLLLDI